MIFRKKQKKVIVIGLDCASPELIFDRFKSHLPNISRMIDGGVSACMRSSDPPITIPAWMSMCSGKDAGEMGIYGFRTRSGHSYTEYDISMSDAFSRVDKIWDILGRQNKKSVLVGVPPSYPPFPVDGCMISGFLCPDTQRDYTFRAELKKEIETVAGPYIPDVPFRIDDRDSIKKNLWETTDKRFQTIEHLLVHKKWDFFMFVEIGVDRLHHAFWKYCDPSHQLYEPGHPYESVVLDYYKFIDEKIGRILALLDKDTVVFTVSDHGAKAMSGVFCLNEWLIEKGYLVLKTYPEKVSIFENLEVDWSRTLAWGWGGYDGKIFINKAGREVQGIVTDDEYEDLRDRLIRGLEEQTDRQGKAWKTKVWKPEKLYKELNGNPPDLIAYFDDLDYRSAGTVGHKCLFLDENDTGPDDAMHDWNGIFIKYDPRQEEKKDLQEIRISDFMPEVMKVFGLEEY